MPHIKIRGMKKEEIQSISTKLLDELSRVIRSPKDHFTLEYIESTFIYDGELHNGGYPFINVDWFSREKETMQETANIITNMVRQFGYEDITVYFTDLKKENYFENGEHF
ncbi:DUF1904 family protein [Clostridiaceae bacterium M8S5]|nr:DUF1904 family protein [Clostridiaceae bacterium M8S5]